VNLPAPTEAFSVFRPTTRATWDFLTPLALFCLSCFGIAFIYSAEFSTVHAMPATGFRALMREDWFKQVVFLALGSVIYVAVSLIDYRFWLSVAHWFYAICIIPLVLVFIPGIGGSSATTWGAQRWINLGLFNYQPSETAKIAVLLITASILIHSKISTVTQSLGALGKLALAVGVPMVLILKQPDLKSAIVLPPMVFAMLYVSKLSPRFFLGALAAFLLLVGLVSIDTWRYAMLLQ
jgi:rod shape determining protein RodA